jgi:ankyrin repeat protein
MDIPQGIYTDIIKHLNPKHILLLSRTCWQIYYIVFEDSINMQLLANKIILDQSDEILEEIYTNDSKYHIDKECANDKIMKYIIDIIYHLNDIYDIHKIFHDICKKASPNIIKYLIDKNIDINCIYYKPWRPIHHIIRRFDTNIELIKYFIDKGTELEWHDGTGMYPIHSACYNSSYEIIKYLLEKNINIDVLCIPSMYVTPSSPSLKPCIKLVVENNKLNKAQKKELILQIHELSNNENYTNKLIDILKN